MGFYQRAFDAYRTRDQKSATGSYLSRFSMLEDVLDEASEDCSGVGMVVFERKNFASVVNAAWDRAFDYGRRVTDSPHLFFAKIAYSRYHSIATFQNLMRRWICQRYNLQLI